MSCYAKLYDNELAVRTFRVQHARYVQVLLGDIERSIQILQGIVLRQLMVIDEIGAVTVNEGAEGQTILETGMKIWPV